MFASDAGSLQKLNKCQPPAYDCLKVFKEELNFYNP